MKKICVPGWGIKEACSLLQSWGGATNSLYQDHHILIEGEGLNSPYRSRWEIQMAPGHKAPAIWISVKSRGMLIVPWGEEIELQGEAVRVLLPAPLVFHAVTRWLGYLGLYGYTPEGLTPSGLYQAVLPLWEVWEDGKLTPHTPDWGVRVQVGEGRWRTLSHEDFPISGQV